MVSAAQPQDSPGNAYYPGTYPMRKPQLGFVYRLECNIADKEVLVGAPHGAGVVRSIAPITGWSATNQSQPEASGWLVGP